ncbi:MAG: hypothetical protein LIO91_11985 [Bacteroidales bacterium]|nr:hypothetical protein [Bacteroidales bacterium]
MKSIERHISFLIARHDCVVVPGFGAFVAQYTPARILRDTGVILPPSRAISFNREIDHNDGMLATSIARAASISYDQAAQSVAEQVAAMKAQLQADGTFTLPFVGSFSQKRGVIEFEPMQSPLIAPQYYGLVPAAITPVIVEARREQQAQEEAILPAPKRWALTAGARRAMRVAASIAVLVCLGALLTTPVIDDRNAPEMASVATMPKVSAPKTVSATSLLPSAPKEAGVLSIAIPTDGFAIADTTQRSKNACAALGGPALDGHHADALGGPALDGRNKEGSERRMVESDPYRLVVASLPSQEQVERFLASNPDKSLRYMESQGRYRVYAATGQSVAQAQEPLRGDLAGKYPGAWVCHK